MTGYIIFVKRLFAPGPRKSQQLLMPNVYLLRANYKTATINIATEYLLRSHLKTAAINFFFFKFFSYLLLQIYKTAANDKQQIRFFPLVNL